MEKMKNKRMNLLAALIFIALFIITAINFKDSDLQGLFIRNAGITVGPITINNPVEQTIKSNNNGLTRIDLLLATYGRVNTSNILFELFDQQGNIIFSQAVAASEIKDNAMFSLDFDTIENSADNVYKIRITSDALSDDNAITAWASESNIYMDGQMFLNGNAVDYDISLATYNSSKVIAKNLVAFSVILLFITIAIAIIYNFFLDSKCGKIITFSCCIVCAILLAMSITSTYNKCILDFATVQSVFTVSGLLRTILFFIPSLLYTSFLFFDYRLISDFIFHKRWIIVGIIFIITVVCDLNASNISMWNEYVQPNIRSELSEPIIGLKRSIRSDEWLCGTPWLATGELVGYGSENNIVRGTYNSGLSASGLYLSYSALSNPFKWGYYLLGFEYGTSFYWMSLIIMSFMLWFELCYIIAKGHRLYALFGGVITGLSQFIMWWSIPVNWVAVPGIIVCAYYFCSEKTKLQKILLALGVVFSCTVFICNLYPAWQVPLAYLVITAIVWIIIEKWSIIKQFKKFDWITIASAFLFMASIVACYLYDNRFYTENVMQTLYPGHRVTNGGWGWRSVLYKTLLFPQTLLYPIYDIGPSEIGVPFSLFPIPFIVSFGNLLYQVVQKIRKKNVKIDVLNITMGISAVFIYIYSAKGFPTWLAEVTLMNYSSPRAYDIFIYICTLLMIRCLAAKSGERLHFPISVSICIAACVAIFSIRISNLQVQDYMPLEYVVFIAICIMALALAVFNSVPPKIKDPIILTGTIIIGFCGLIVNPITCGVEALKSKPAAIAIQEIVKKDPDAKWASLNHGQYIIANGGSCITSVNYVPNMDLWTELDPEGKYEEIYNRYAHVGLILTQEQTSFTLVQADAITLNLNYSDMEKCEIKYLASSYPIYENSDDVDFKMLYNEDNYMIYEVIYL